MGDQGGHLLWMDTQEKWDTLPGLLKGCTNDYIQVGGHRKLVSETPAELQDEYQCSRVLWQWGNGKPVIESVPGKSWSLGSAWAKAGDDCLALIGVGDKPYDKWRCSNFRPYICEFKM